MAWELLYPRLTPPTFSFRSKVNTLKPTFPVWEGEC